MRGNRVTIRELAKFYGVDRHTMARKLKKQAVNLACIEDILEYVRHNPRSNGASTPRGVTDGNRLTIYTTSVGERVNLLG